MPRKFESHDDEKMIYDEEDEVPEMYFFNEGTIGIGFSLVANGVTNQQHFIVKKLTCPQLICDHYVVSQQKSQFIYMTYHGECKGFCLTKQFLHDRVFPKYPELFKKLMADSHKFYKKNIFRPINEERKVKIQQLNKQSVYRNITFIDKEVTQPSMSEAKGDSLSTFKKNKVLAE